MIPSFSISACCDRLWFQYQKHPKLIIAVDFDDTVKPWLVHSDSLQFTTIHTLLRRAASHGFLIVIYTASDPSRWAEMKGYLEERGIPVASVNTNPIALPYGAAPQSKIYYNLFIDDKAGPEQACQVLVTILDRIESRAAVTAQAAVTPSIP